MAMHSSVYSMTHMSKKMADLALYSGKASEDWGTVAEKTGVVSSSVTLMTSLKLN